MFGNKFRNYLPVTLGLLTILAILSFSTQDDHIDMRRTDIDMKKVVRFEFKENKFDTAELRKEIISLDIKHPNIVYAQAKLETGNFKSKLFLNQCNLFGFKNKKGKWMTFEDWKSCCKYYKTWQEKRYKGGDYYQFLVKVNYAEDINYIEKVKKCLN